MHYVSLSDGKLVEKAKADVCAEKALTTPVVSRRHHGTAYSLLVYVVYVQIHRPSLVHVDILCEGLQVRESQLLSSKHEVFKGLQVSLLCWTSQVHVSNRQNLVVCVIVLLIPHFRSQNSLVHILCHRFLFFEHRAGPFLLLTLFKWPWKSSQVDVDKSRSLLDHVVDLK